MVDCLSGFHGLSIHPEFMPCVRVSIPPVDINAGYLHSYTMSLFNNIAACPQVNLMLVYFARLDERNLAVGFAILGINNAFPYHVGIAIATACNPRLLILDEPVTWLDVIVQRQLLNLINDLREKLRLTIIFITHDLSVIAETCSKVAVMYAGKIVGQADAVSLYENPIHPYSKLLIEAYPSIKGEKGELVSILGAPPWASQSTRGMLFPPALSLGHGYLSGNRATGDEKRWTPGVVPFV